MMAGNSSFLTVEKAYGRHDGRPFKNCSLSRKSLLLLLKLDAGPRVLPIEIHRAATTALVKGDGKVLDLGGCLGDVHVGPQQLIGLILVRDAPLTSFLVDD